mgnify:FL=1
MKIIIGKTSGFCGGVQNAVIKTEKELNNNKSDIYCLGEIVHNKQVIENLKRQGLKVIENIEDAKGKTIIRAHGVPKEIYNKAKEQNIELVDLTCPKVVKIHDIAEEYTNKGYFVILVGVEEHPETIGTISFCGNNHYLIRDINDIKFAIEKIKNSGIKKVLVISQTTYSLAKFNNIIEKLKENLENDYELEIKNTICSATKMRQEETEELSKIVDFMIIVGGKNSSNTKKLYEISKTNCSNVILVETADEINFDNIKKYETIGIMAGASTPKESVEEIKNKLNKYGD